MVCFDLDHYGKTHIDRAWRNITEGVPMRLNQFLDRYIYKILAIYSLVVIGLYTAPLFAH